MAQSNILTKTDTCDNVEIVDEVEAIKKKRSYEGSFLGWYDIVLDGESLCAVIPIRTHTRELVGRHTKENMRRGAKKTSTHRSMTLKVR